MLEVYWLGFFFGGVICGGVGIFIGTAVARHKAQSTGVQAAHVPQRTLKHHDRATLIRRGWMTHDGKWTSKGMPDKAA